ncbi:MAG: hypothetical protein ACT4PM_02675 [Gemmatimonadales bacterium]
MRDQMDKGGAAVRLFLRLAAGALPVGCGATSPSPPPPPAPPAQTDAGVPQGVPSIATIGAAGGTLASSDGRLTISVPAGALTAGTAITIQPITATAPGALGSGYRLLPEGMTFAQPVTLTFIYPGDEAVATGPQSLRVVTQDARGYWIIVPANHDVAQRKLAVTTTHFSDWSYIAGLQIKPASATVAVNKLANRRWT